MRTDPLYLALKAADKAPEFNPGGTIDKTQVLAIAALSLVLVGISLVTAFTIGTKGHFSKAAAVVLTVLILLIPAGIAITYSMKSFLPGLTGWLF